MRGRRKTPYWSRYGDGTEDTTSELRVERNTLFPLKPRNRPRKERLPKAPGYRNVENSSNIYHGTYRIGETVTESNRTGNRLESNHLVSTATATVENSSNYRTKLASDHEPPYKIKKNMDRIEPQTPKSNPSHTL